MVPPVSRGTVRIQSFTEPSAARHLEVVGSSTFVVTAQGLERWSRDGGVATLPRDAGLHAGDILSVAADAERAGLWILTPGALGRLPIGAAAVEELDGPPKELGLDLEKLAPGDRTALTAAGPGGVWVGTPQGLFRVDADGWRSTPIKDAVLSLADGDDGLLVASPRGLVRLDAFGEVTRIGVEEGCLVVRPARVVAAPKLGGTLVFGSDERGAPRVAIGRGQSWHSYRLLPDLEIRDVAAASDAVVVLGAGQVYRIALRDESEPRPLARDGVRLSALSTAGPDLAIASTPALLPANAISVAASDEHVLVGTRDIGVARYRPGDARPSSWLRRRPMFDSASTLSVACAARDNCWVATGGRSAWHWSGERFTAGGPDEPVLAVARSKAGAIFALHRERSSNIIRLARVDPAGRWTRVNGVELTTPGSDPEVSFARFAASGALWVGLRYHQGDEVRTWGVAVVEPGGGKPRLHLAGALGGGQAMTIPFGLRDAEVHGEQGWFASDDGVTRVVGASTTRWAEREGLRSARARAIAVTRQHTVFVATTAGIGRFDGQAWTFPAQLAFEANDLAVTGGGQLWMATSRGVAVYDGAKVRRIDLRRGLVENELFDITVDRFDRIWARGSGSLTLISP
ncbi:MAG: hypothetical protein R3B48_18415 [Kofleriaceae bacterium]